MNCGNNHYWIKLCECFYLPRNALSWCCFADIHSTLKWYGIQYSLTFWAGLLFLLLVTMEIWDHISHSFKDGEYTHTHTHTNYLAPGGFWFLKSLRLSTQVYSMEMKLTLEIYRILVYSCFHSPLVSSSFLRSFQLSQICIKILSLCFLKNGYHQAGWHSP